MFLHLRQWYKSTVYPVELRIFSESDGTLKFILSSEPLSLRQLKKFVSKYRGGFSVMHPLTPSLGYILFNAPVINDNGWSKTSKTNLEFTELQLAAKSPSRYKLLRNLLPVWPPLQKCDS